MTTKSKSSLNVSYYSANFGGHRYCGRADIRLYICYVTMSPKVHVTWWMPRPTLSYPLQGRCNISNLNGNFVFNVHKLPTFSLSYVHVSPAPFLNPYKIRPDFNFYVYILLNIYLMIMWLNKS